MLKTNELDAAAKVMHAMAHPLRLGILQCLIDQEKNVSELYEELNCSQSMMSQQLQILEAAGLVQSRKEGTAKFFSIKNTDFLNLFHCMENHLQRYFKIG